jgi:hypothetical protein
MKSGVGPFLKSWKLNEKRMTIYIGGIPEENFRLILKKYQTRDDYYESLFY